MSSLGPRLKRLIELILLSLIGSVPVAAFFISALFPGYTPFSTAETGTTLILTPLVIGILFGFLMSEQDIRSAAAGSLVITVFSSVFIVVFVVSPIIAGVASVAPAVSPNELMEIFIAQRILLFIVISFPVLLLGAIVGRALSERIMPSEELRRELEKLRAETREWHRILESKARERGPPEAERGAETQSLSAKEEGK